MHDRRYVPVPGFVIPNYNNRFLLAKKAMRGIEAFCADHDLLIWNCLDVAKPIRFPSETAHNHGLRGVFSVFHNFENGLALNAGATASMSQKQESAPKQAAEMQVIKIDWRTEEIPQPSFLVEQSH